MHALIDVNLAVEARELVAIMGPSGSGKTTLLTVAGTLEDAHSGDVIIDGTPVVAMSRNDRAAGCAAARSATSSRTSNLLAGLTGARKRLAAVGTRRQSTQARTGGRPGRAGPVRHGRARKSVPR